MICIYASVCVYVYECMYIILRSTVYTNVHMYVSYVCRCTYIFTVLTHTHNVYISLLSKCPG